MNKTYTIDLISDIEIDEQKEHKIIKAIYSALTRILENTDIIVSTKTEEQTNEF